MAQRVKDQELSCCGSGSIPAQRTSESYKHALHQKRLKKKKDLKPWESAFFLCFHLSQRASTLLGQPHGALGWAGEGAEAEKQETRALLDGDLKSG